MQPRSVEKPRRDARDGDLSGVAEEGRGERAAMVELLGVVEKGREAEGVEVGMEEGG